MATLFESQGHEVWVKLREHVGAPVDPALAAAEPRHQQTIAEREAAKAAKVSLAAQNAKALARVVNAGKKPDPLQAAIPFGSHASTREALQQAGDYSLDHLDEELFGPIDIVELLARGDDYVALVDKIVDES